MDNIPLATWGFLGFLSGLSGIFVLYRIHRQKQIQLLSAIEKAEIELLEDLQKLSKIQTENPHIISHNKVLGGTELSMDQLTTSKDKKQDGQRSFSGRMRTIPIIGAIPAGIPINVLPSPVDYVEQDHVLIGNKEYFIFNLLPGEKELYLPLRGQNYYVLRVAGNSMNRAKPEPIKDGDYVILREQNIADHGDIIAAIIVKGDGEDHQATLKRFVVRDWKIFLQPESDDPEFQKPVYSQSFANPNDEFQIRGVAIGVLKPIVENSKSHNS